MANSLVDYRRTDQRITVLESPYWITSAEVAFADLAGRNQALLFSWGKDCQGVIIQDIVVQMTEKPNHMSNAASFKLGLGYLKSDTATVSGTYSALSGTISSVHFIRSADGALFTSLAAVCVKPYGGVRTSSPWSSAKMLGCTVSSRNMILGDSVSSPCVYATVQPGAGTFTAGKFRVHMLVAKVPGAVARS